MASYIHTRTLTSMDIEKYRSLVRTLKNIPPVDTGEEGHAMTAGDSLLLVTLDSLRLHLNVSHDPVSETSKSLVSLMKGEFPTDNEPLVLTGEMLELLKTRVPNIICIQPFGCLPNHVVGKGVIKQLKKAFPDSNIAAVDYDPGASEVNQLNRIKLMLSVAKEKLGEEK